MSGSVDAIFPRGGLAALCHARADRPGTGRLANRRPPAGDGMPGQRPTQARKARP